ncbi:adenylate kinase family protein [Wolbachia endosymbiont of Howardula sp.]|uniref:adenylate kinase family protein n=1 Tax=Wolbachia endosymbiont of Howardula sp. TaxID=2916816 RepID=UPI00217D779B|nr:nucleoside monophosphate kinase [Wolbachia endosymbiont of Howardula sp.]UWI83151.1 nucleoside monophosphate kinase [Wolbachia endosymbiont of Howardula sp.]
MIITIFGPPGSGKGTQAHLLKIKYNLKLISMGNLLRNIIATENTLGKKIKDTVESGQLIQDDIICELLLTQMNHEDENYILDGFPRNIRQANFLTQILLEKNHKDIDIAIVLQLSDRIVINRLNNRLICLDCANIYSISSFKESNNKSICIKCHSSRIEKRIDDINIETINKRIHEYYFQMKTLKTYYSNQLVIIDAQHNVDQIMQKIESEIFISI